MLDVDRPNNDNGMVISLCGHAPSLMPMVVAEKGWLMS